MNWTVFRRYVLQKDILVISSLPFKKIVWKRRKKR